MVATSGFVHAPVSRFLIFALIATSLSSSIFEIKHLLPIKPTPHLWPYLQFSRIFTFQLAYASSTELLFGISLVYQMRVLERLWGSRKYASFVAVSWGVTGLIVVVLGTTLKIITLGWWGYIPPGVTGMVFAILGVWKDEIPTLYGVEVVSGLKTASREVQGEHARSQDARTNNNRAEKGIVLSDKFTTYLLAAQMALSQFPYQLLPAVVGWIVGAAWREELLPLGLMRWRMPGWIVGEDNSSKRSRGQYEGLRRRLEEEGGARDGMREATDGLVTGEGGQQVPRGFGRSVIGYFTGS